MPLILRIAAAVLFVVGVWCALVMHRPETHLADQVCFGLGGGDNGLCFPTPH